MRCNIVELGGGACAFLKSEISRSRRSAYARMTPGEAEDRNLSTKVEIAVQFAVAALISAALVAVTSAASRPGAGPDPRFASPEATLNRYFEAILAVDEDAELATGTAEIRALAERNRGPDKARRKKLLAGKAAFFKRFPPRIMDVKILGDRAKILVFQGGTEERPISYVYSFHRVGGNWKISNIERRHDLSW